MPDFTRRAFLTALGGTIGTPALVHAGLARRGLSAAAETPPPRIDAERLRRKLEGLSVHGRRPGGTFADGVSRLGYSDADVAGRAYARQLLEAAGLEPRIDPAGNIVARRPGREASLPPVLFGSHIDSVPQGGNFDGDVGSMSAIEAVETLKDHAITTRRPLEVVLWVNEEGVAYGKGLDGSRAAAGKLIDGELDQVWNGVRRADAIRRIGGDPDRIAEARRAPGSFHAYLELHIEQGGNLDRERVPIGVVEGIVGIDHYEAVVRGFANHAGTTAMADRHDALLAAAKLALAVREIVTAEPGRQVGTVGEMHVEPNAPNVIPGLVRHSIELRDLDAAKIARLGEAVKARAGEIAAETGTEIEVTLQSRLAPALATPEIQSTIETVAGRLGFATRRLPSGAGHDAQMMALLGPIGMIFVPSVGGISHSPKELSRWEDIARGADVLLGTVLALAG
jgi:beta-ureidopropionase / N-carbamoyl-L-amino-acid hydrolase